MLKFLAYLQLIASSVVCLLVWCTEVVRVVVSGMQSLLIDDDRLQPLHQHQPQTLPRLLTLPLNRLLTQASPLPLFHFNSSSTYCTNKVQGTLYEVRSTIGVYHKTKL